MTMRQCQRYLTDGTRCGNLTDYHDGWCREPSCPGYVRVAAENAPESLGAPHGTRKHIAESGHVRVGGSDLDLERVRVSQRALDSFRFHHGGGASEARVQILAMLEDFLLKSARLTTQSGLLQLAREGYELVVTADAHVITGYQTVHRERTWEQVKAGVPSRLRGSRRRTEHGERPEAGPPVEVENLLTVFRADSIHLTARALTSFARLADLRDADDEMLAARLREALQWGPGASPRRREDGLVEVTTAEHVWILSADARIVIGVKRARDQVEPGASD
jgi:hypothetical protein